MNTNTNKLSKDNSKHVIERYAPPDNQITPISIDEDARDTLDRYFYDNPLSPIRIYITTQSPKGPKLALRPDAQTEKDVAFEAEDYTFLISPHLAHQLGHIRIAAYDMGFQVIPEHPLGHKKSHPEA